MGRKWGGVRGEMEMGWKWGGVRFRNGVEMVEMVEMGRRPI
ncbi:MAG: hypothetical protein RLZZ230_382 [Candidatus Parcubacteria bacterium]|jgi:hypothetical protein